MGVPTETLTPAGSELKIRSDALTLEKLTGRLKVNVTVLGESVAVRAVGRA